MCLSSTSSQFHSFPQFNKVIISTNLGNFLFNSTIFKLSLFLILNNQLNHLTVNHFHSGPPQNICIDSINLIHILFPAFSLINRAGTGVGWESYICCNELQLCVYPDRQWLVKPTVSSKFSEIIFVCYQNTTPFPARCSWSFVDNASIFWLCFPFWPHASVTFD